MPAAGLYIHIPFCQKKCGYCDFYSITTLNQREGFVEALLREIELVSARYRDYRFDTLFVGGGTPTMLEPGQIRRIWRHLQRYFDMDPRGEFSIEANPGTLTPALLRDLREMGFNRLSMGVQSFQEADLRFLGRIHSVEEVYRNFDAARRAGFQNINLDLMTAFPGLSEERFRDTLHKAVQLAPEHISCYTLIFEPRTPFYNRLQRGTLKALNDEEEARFYQMANQELGLAGYRAYEISNFSREDRFRCRHNLKYWDHQPYLGLGPSAHSFILPRRWWNVRRLGPYLQRLKEDQLPVAGSEELTRETLEFEYIFLHLRLREGIDTADYSRRFGRPFRQSHRAALEKWLTGGFLEQENNYVRLNNKGWLLADQIALSF